MYLLWLHESNVYISKPCIKCDFRYVRPISNFGLMAFRDTDPGLRFRKMIYDDVLCVSGVTGTIGSRAEKRMGEKGEREGGERRRGVEGEGREEEGKRGAREGREGREHGGDLSTR